jgi:hypothetical protein
MSITKTEALSQRPEETAATTSRWKYILDDGG